MGCREGSLEPLQAWRELCGGDDGIRYPLEVMIPDPVHSGTESRFVSIGLSEAGQNVTSGFESSARGTPLLRSGDSMSRNVNSEDSEDMLPEYDFAGGVRGKHHEAYKAGTNVVFLEPDGAKVFTDSASVNRVLRLLLNLAKENIPPNKPT